MPDDLMFWWPNKNRVYSVRSGYWLGMRIQPPVVEMGEDQGASIIWRMIWTVEIPPKLSHFLWRASTNILAVRSNLAHRHYVQDPLCELCKEENETVNHALLECGWAKNLWADSVFFPLLSLAPAESFTKRLAWMLQNLDKAARGKFLAMLWAIWYMRNLRVFDSETTQPSVVIVGMTKIVMDYERYRKEVGFQSHKHSVEEARTWTAPPYGCGED
ncbi:uncharacterized protein LOC141614172 [Silene latifolia]|uniref:uncharacterized protein LOC141614172 n=1 Tax=Silene latifolia TaxID=37657 RepID=UPI003D785BBD